MDPFVLQCKAQAIFWVIFFRLAPFLPNDSVTLSEELRHVTPKLSLSRKLRQDVGHDDPEPLPDVPRNLGGQDDLLLELAELVWQAPRLQDPDECPQR